MRYDSARGIYYSKENHLEVEDALSCYDFAPQNKEKTQS